MLHEIDTKAYLYTRRRGFLEVIEGGVEMARRPRWDKSRFYYLSNGKETYIKCANNAGEMLNGTVWMVVRNDDRARMIFLDYERDCIDKLEEQLENHYASLEALKIEQIKVRS